MASTSADTAGTENRLSKRSSEHSLTLATQNFHDSTADGDLLSTGSVDKDTLSVDRAHGVPKKSVSFSKLAGSGSLKMTSGPDGREPSSEDEHTSMLSSHRDSGQHYSAVGGSSARASGIDEPTSPTSPAGAAGFLKSRKQAADKGKSVSLQQTSESTWWTKVKNKYGSVELENKGSVARDHLALERTFLAWLRTSLSFASIGIAVTQLFRLNTSIGTVDPNHPALNHLRRVGKPLGATFIGVAIVVLFLGFNRYFESQHYIIRGKFPASRGSILIMSVMAFALTVVSLTVILVIGGSTLAT